MEDSPLSTASKTAGWPVLVVDSSNVLLQKSARSAVIGSSGRYARMASIGRSKCGTRHPLRDRDFRLCLLAAVPSLACGRRGAEHASTRVLNDWPATSGMHTPRTASSDRRHVSGTTLAPVRAPASAPTIAGMESDCLGIRVALHRGDQVAGGGLGRWPAPTRLSRGRRFRRCKWSSRCGRAKAVPRRTRSRSGPGSPWLAVACVPARSRHISASAAAMESSTVPPATATAIAAVMAAAASIPSEALVISAMALAIATATPGEEWNRTATGTHRATGCRRSDGGCRCRWPAGADPS